jgi:SAM-dependent methyltransferase
VFARSARYYDVIYGFKDYAAEAAELDRRIQEARPGAATLLDVACGTGAHLRFLTASYRCEGVDISPELLAIAAERVPDAVLHEADMTSFSLGRRFDAVVCLFSSIGYVGTPERLDAAIGAMASHLAPGGVLLVEPWLEPEVWQDGHLSALFVDEEDVKLARLGVARTEGRLAVLELAHLIATRDGVERFDERHELALFTVDEHLAAFRRAGLDARHDPGGLIGRGMYTARAPG